MRISDLSLGYFVRHEHLDGDVDDFLGNFSPLAILLGGVAVGAIRGGYFGLC